MRRKNFLYFLLLLFQLSFILEKVFCYHRVSTLKVVFLTIYIVIIILEMINLIILQFVYTSNTSQQQSIIMDNSPVSTVQMPVSIEAFQAELNVDRWCLFREEMERLQSESSAMNLCECEEREIKQEPMDVTIEEEEEIVEQSYGCFPSYTAYLQDYDRQVAAQNERMFRIEIKREEDMAIARNQEILFEAIPVCWRTRSNLIMNNTHVTNLL